MSKKPKKVIEVDNELEKLYRQKEHLLQSIKNKEKLERQKERKKRANRLIETGALAEKYFEIHKLSIAEREELFKMFATFIKSNKPNHLKK